MGVFNSGKNYRDVYEKRDELFSRYKSGYLSKSQVARELGYANFRDVEEWLSGTEIEPTLIGKRVKYEINLLAKVLVARRGMV